MLLREKLGIDFEVVNERAEVYAFSKKEYYDVVISRAVSNMPVLCELSIPFVKINGEIIAYKGIVDGDNGEYASKVLGAEIKNVYYDKLPIDDANRAFICIQKKCKTSDIYPRRYDKIVKKPLQNLVK